MSCLSSLISLKQRNEGDDTDREESVLKRATRSVPGCGAIWAKYLRFLVRCDHNALLPFSDFL